MTRTGLRLISLLLCLAFASGEVQAARRPALEQLRSQVRVASLGGLADGDASPSAGPDLGGAFDPGLREYRSAETGARRAALAEARRVFAAGKADALARARMRARRAVARRRARGRGVEKAQAMKLLGRARHGEKKRLWRRAMEAGLARYRVLEQRAYQQALVVAGGAAEAEATSWEDALPEEGFAGEGFREPTPKFRPAPLDGGQGSSTAMFGLPVS